MAKQLWTLHSRPSAQRRLISLCLFEGIKGKDVESLVSGIDPSKVYTPLTSGDTFLRVKITR